MTQTLADGRSDTMPVSEQAFRKLALEEPNVWELHCGTPRQKPAMSWEHNYLGAALHRELVLQLDPHVFQVRSNIGHVRRSAAHYYIPDVYVVPAEVVRQHRGGRELEVYTSPLPLVVEIWSPSTGDYDVEEKLPEYQRRGDLEIWRLHPYEHTLTAWRRQPDGSYTETLYTGGVVRPVALPGVAIDLDALFA
jgi:Uma2 family endonuclease